MKRGIAWSLVFGVLLFIEKANAQHCMLSLRFVHFVGNDTLKLNDKVYLNASNEPFTVNKFKYYVSNVKLLDSSGQGVNSNGINLINETGERYNGFIIGDCSLRNGNPSFIEFTIGVDSTYNVNSKSWAGDLDPMKGMYWTWNSGYVFAKLEGQSDSSHAAAHYFMYDVGGYKKQHNAIRKVRLAIDKNSWQGSTLIINVDILKWFNSASNISISQTPLCHEPGKLAMQLADNYATMFSIAEVKQ